MARFLAGLEFPKDFGLGPENKLPEGNIVHHYYEKNSGKVLRTLLLGTIAAVVERKNEPTIIILSAPEAISPVTKEIFLKQATVLNHVMQAENHDMSRASSVHHPCYPKLTQNSQRIINKEVWSQGTGEDGKGAVYVRTTEETQNDILNMSENCQRSQFECIYKEIPKSQRPPMKMAIGSTIVCYVYPFRVDVPIPQSPNIDKVHARAYGLHASNTVQMYRTQ
ncbi:hypothetical protein DFH06DRAFT_1129502 [Mycena polygramma]|nr:hypothetical protein DFH06DRAFT_1129502 [Mycena polygramma]